MRPRHDSSVFDAMRRDFSHGVQHFKVIVFIVDSIATLKGATLTEETKVLAGLVANEQLLPLSSP
jgi:hypothetical protein